MNLLHLKYAVVIAETNSMTKAADLLFTAQPNLSRAIKELESTLGITVFRRTSKGIFPTPQGEEFLGYARKILAQVDAVEAMYKSGAEKAPQFSLSTPGANYAAAAFAEFAKKLDSAKKAELIYNETVAPMRVLSNVTDAGYNLGILRCQNAQEHSIKSLLGEKQLQFELICEFEYMLVMSASHPLAGSGSISADKLNNFTEIASADPYAPTLQLSTARKNDIETDPLKRIYVFDRSSRLRLLNKISSAFMLASPLPKSVLDELDLVQKPCKDSHQTYRDMLIYRRGYQLSDMDNAFIDELMKVKRSMGLNCD